jgi:hypothetical protein
MATISNIQQLFANHQSFTNNLNKICFYQKKLEVEL